ncbi:MAG: MFS transporter [Acidobacteriota bacterium]
MTDGKPKARRIHEAVRALRHRNYRIYYFGMLVSFTGTWMQSVAQSWLIYRLTGSAWLLGLVGFAGQVPVFLLAPLGGVMADRHSRHRIVIITQTLAMLQAFALAALTIGGLVTVQAVFALAILLGVVNAFDLPTRQSFMVELVGREDLMNAIALNSSMIQASRVLGPALAGLLVGWLGEGPCFLINGISYLAVIGGLFAIRVRRERAGPAPGSAFSHLKEGFDYVLHTSPVRALLLLVAFVSIFGLPYIVLMPIFASEVLKGGPRALGVLLGAAGAGALAGALTLAARRHVEGLGRVVALSVAALGSMLILFSLSRNLIISAVLLVPAGFALILQMSASNTLVQTMAPDGMRGRLMSFYSMSLMGMAPFGSLLAGAVAARIGAPATVAGGGALCIVASLFFWSRLPHLRREAVRVLVAQGAMAGEPTVADSAQHG